MKNEISDITPLQDLTSLRELDVTLNPVSDYSCVEFVPYLNELQ